MIVHKSFPIKDAMRYGKKEKLSSRYIEPYIIIRRVGQVAYVVKLPQELDNVDPVCYVSMMHTCIVNPSLIVPPFTYCPNNRNTNHQNFHMKRF